LSFLNLSFSYLPKLILINNENENMDLIFRLI
jgi:hypothetical protein